MFATVGGMTPTPDAQAAVWGAALRMRAELRHLEGTHRLARSRQESPELFEAADQVVAALDSVDPPIPLPGFIG